jgi:hypothetical protein
MMFSALRLPLFLAAVGLFTTQAALMRAVESDPDALETALKHTTVTLQDELKANEQEGEPISGKFEIEHDALQLSVYTLDGDDFLEVIADPETGAIAKTEKIADADDLGDATAQKAAMEEATVSLLAVADAAASANPGLRVVSIYPQLRNDHPVAEVTLLTAWTLPPIVVGCAVASTTRVAFCWTCTFPVTVALDSMQAAPGAR